MARQNDVFLLGKYNEALLNGDIGNILYSSLYRWFTGGDVSSKLDRIAFVTDTATASIRGNLTQLRSSLAATGNTTDGWFGSGHGGPGNPGLDIIDRITFATDTVTALARGSLSVACIGLAATGNSTNGWFGGGYNTVTTLYLSRLDRITYATDTDNATARGNLSTERYYLAAVGNTTDGWFGSGYYQAGGGAMVRLDRITYATDTANATIKGSISIARYKLSATRNTTDGWFGGGGNGSYFSTVDRITYATDTAATTVKGSLSIARDFLAATGNLTDGWFGGGGNSYASVVDRITYATDTATASVRGSLSQGRSGLAAV